MIKDRRILQRILIVFLVFCMQQAVMFIPGFSASREAKGNIRSVQKLSFLLNDRLDFETPPAFHSTAHEDDWASIRNSTQGRRRLRFYQIVTKQFSTSTKVIQLVYDHSPLLMVKEDKGGEYQKQDSFLPAYYSFLFRCALF